MAERDNAKDSGGVSPEGGVHICRRRRRVRRGGGGLDADRFFKTSPPKLVFIRRGVGRGFGGRRDFLKDLGFRRKGRVLGDFAFKRSALFACERCRDLIEGGKLPKDTDSLRFLEGPIWSEVFPVQLTAIRLLRRVGEAKVDWAQRTLEDLWIPENVEEHL